MTVAALPDFREAARRRLPRFLFDYVDGGSFDEGTLRRNQADLAAVELRQRVLRDVAQIDTSREILGTQSTLPIALGPVGLAGMLARRGEIQAARAAGVAGVPLCLSTTSVCSLIEMAQASAAPAWFQLYVVRDRALMIDLLAQAAAAHCTALLVTVDTPITGVRRRDYRSGLIREPGWRGGWRRYAQALRRPHWAVDVGLRGRPHTLGNFAAQVGARAGLDAYLAWTSGNIDHSLGWDDIAYLRQHWRGPLVIKGVLDAEDAQQARGVGADGIVVSNHGGRQLDGAPSTARALPTIAEAVGGAMTILADSGVRSGTDIVRLIALGADAVMIGRLWAYALAADGEAGVARLLALLEAELRIAMALTGSRTIKEIDRQVLHKT